MIEDEIKKKDPLFDIDMQLYDEFNYKICEIYEHLGDIYTYKDLRDIKEAEKAKEIILLRELIKKQEEEKNKINKMFSIAVALLMQGDTYKNCSYNYVVNDIAQIYKKGKENEIN